jgi:hypothetical protein
MKHDETVDINKPQASLAQFVVTSAKIVVGKIAASGWT